MHAPASLPAGVCVGVLAGAANSSIRPAPLTLPQTCTRPTDPRYDPHNSNHDDVSGAIKRYTVPGTDVLVVDDVNQR